MKKSLVVIGTLVCSLLASKAAFAQVSRLGESFSVWTATSRGSAVAYDPRNHVYLVVSAHGLVYGRFVNADGAVLGEPFVLQGVPMFGQFPQIAYSPDAHGIGAFLVTWHESDGAAPSIHTRLVSYTHGFLSGDRIIVGNDTYHEIMGAPVAYSTTSREFLVVWRQYADTNIFGIRLNANGDPLTGAIPIAASPAFESDPSLTYSPATDEFFVVYRHAFTNVLGQRVKAGTGALVGGPSLVAQAPTINTTGVTYNPTTGQYLAAWHQMPGDVVVGRVIGLDGTPVGNVTPLSTRVGTYDSLSVDVNEVSGTSMLVGHDKWSVEVGGVEIAASGAPFTGGQALTGSGGAGNHVPKVSSSLVRPEWLIVAARDFARPIAQRIGTSSSGGGQPPPPPAASNPVVGLDGPGNGTTIEGVFPIFGWAVDLGAAAGTGIDLVHVWAFPTSGGPQIFLGSANLGGHRPDVAGHFGRAQFASAGYWILAYLNEGTYRRQNLRAQRADGCVCLRSRPVVPHHCGRPGFSAGHVSGSARPASGGFAGLCDQRMGN